MKKKSPTSPKRSIKKYGKLAMAIDFRGWLDENEGEIVQITCSPKAFVAVVVPKHT